MRVLFFFPLIFLHHQLFSQIMDVGKNQDPSKDLTGLYRVSFAPTEQSKIYKEGNKLMIELIGQGRGPLSFVSGDSYKIKVKPEININFVRDSSGKVQKFLWLRQPQKVEWSRIDEPINDSTPATNSKLFGLTGRYKLKNNPYRILTIRNENNRLTYQVADHPVYELKPQTENIFSFQMKDYKTDFEFVRNREGKVEKVFTEESGPLEWIKDQNESVRSGTNGQNGFTRADSLRGMLTQLRTCYDVTFYGLDVKVEPQTKSIEGNTLIRFKTVQSFDKMQIDLYENMKIEKILFRGEELAYTREFNAVFIQFPFIVPAGNEEEIRVMYSGKPQEPDISTLKGGFLWLQDKKGNPWIESVCQGSGASLWWPCKDHLSDKPDSMKISITIPRGLTEISNGRLIEKKELTDKLTRFDWYVDYPINNYNVVVNIGDYAHFSDLYVSGSDTLNLNYYCMPYNIEKAKQIFSHVKPMLSLYERDFAKYPFWRDGFTLMESLYPMEHQSAVSIGSINNPINSDRYDSSDMIRTAWHESAHEWWGNSLNCKDIADLWIHEAFATYAEVLSYEKFYGEDAALKYLKSEPPANKKPVIGVYNVNDFRLGDMYTKGALMLHTLRNIINNDSLWFDMLRGLQEHFKYQAVSTDDIVGYINGVLQKDYTYFFDQYLRHAAIPELLVHFEKEGSSTKLQYKWKTDVKGFSMPVKVTVARNNFAFIYPTDDWQSMILPGMKPKDFKADTDRFYVTVKEEQK